MDYLNLEDVKDYMDDELYESWRIKLEWMIIGKKKNILKNIRLLELKPISVFDNEDDSRDFIWYYIKGNMIDYTINTENYEIIDGSDKAEDFVEFWKFVRNENDKWVLSKILQENEKNKILFQMDEQS